MRFIFGWGNKLFVWENSVARVAMRVAGEAAEEGEELEEPLSHDPHSTVSAHCELSPAVVYDTAKAKRFGFG